MATRTKGERSSIEKKQRIERTVIPLVCAVAVAVFILLGAVLGKKPAKIEPEATPAPTEDPIVPTADKLAELLGGSVVSTATFSVVSYQSRADGAYGTVTVYPKSELVCLRTVRSVYRAPEVTPDPYEDMFESTVKTEEPEAVGDPTDIQTAAAELLSILECAYGPSANEGAGESIASAISRLIADGAKKSSCVYGIYLLEFEYSPSDALLTLTCEPA